MATAIIKLRTGNIESVTVDWFVDGQQINTAQLSPARKIEHETELPDDADSVSVQATVRWPNGATKTATAMIHV